jgi:prepilin-type N-terminal cleavage/methylation domain-containing protein
MSARCAPAACGRRGFTLLEVLASVAILGIVFTLLSGVAARWLAAEGEARRRMRAALLADQALADIEADVASGRVPPPGDSEEADPEQLFQIAKRVQNLNLPVELCERIGPKSSLVQTGKPMQTLCSTTPGGPTYLRAIEVAVSWEEAGQPIEITRKTVAFDLEAARPILDAIPRPEGEGGGGDTGGAGEDSGGPAEPVDRNRGPNREGNIRGPEQPDVAPNSQTLGVEE